MSHESGGNAHAANHNSNGSYDVGLWQINSVNWGSWYGSSILFYNFIMSMLFFEDSAPGKCSFLYLVPVVMLLATPMRISPAPSRFGSGVATASVCGAPAVAVAAVNQQIQRVLDGGALGAGELCQQIGFVSFRGEQHRRNARAPLGGEMQRDPSPVAGSAAPLQQAVVLHAIQGCTRPGGPQASWTSTRGGPTRPRPARRPPARTRADFARRDGRRWGAVPAGLTMADDLGYVEANVA